MGRARSLQELAECDGITRRYIRRLVGLAILSPQLVEAILQRQQSVELTATRLTELDLLPDWIEQHRLKPQFRTGMAQAAAHRVRASLQTIGTFRRWGLKLPRFRGVLASLVDYASVGCTSIACS